MIVIYWVYILSSDNNKTIYTGVTNNLKRRVCEHKNGVVEGFTRRYNVHKLVYFEKYYEINYAIHRGKQIKGLLRRKKDDLINGMNPEWSDLYEKL